MSISRVVVNGVEYKIDYNSLDNLPDLSKLTGLDGYVSEDDIESDLNPNSDNPISSRAVYNALQQLSLEGANVTVDDTIENGSVNPVCGGAVYQAVEDLYAHIDTVGGQIYSDLNAQTASLNTKINGQATTLGNKVDKVDGKGLSTNDFTNSYKDVLDRKTQGLLPIPTSGDSGKIPVVRNGTWTYATLDSIAEFAENGSF